MAKGSKLNRKQELAIACLMSEPTHADAAAKAGISPATLQRWLTDSEFTRAYRAARATVFEGAVARLQRAASAAAERLHANLTCGQPTAEIAAARTILEHARDGVNVFDLQERLSELEKCAARREEERKREEQQHPNGRQWS